MRSIGPSRRNTGRRPLTALLVAALVAVPAVVSAESEPVPFTNRGAENAGA